MIPIVWSIDHPDLIIGVVEADAITIAPSSPGLLDEVASCVAQRKTDWPPDTLKQGIREMLRHSGYRPSGRNKPASEYLSGAARKNRFPTINNVVDINNMMSLRTGWPISVLDRTRALGEQTQLEVRLGKVGENYVFNTAGQEIDLKNLIGIGQHNSKIIANPVKDAMLAKTDANTQQIIAFLYTTQAVATVDEVQAVAQTYGELLATYAGAVGVQSRVVHRTL